MSRLDWGAARVGVAYTASPWWRKHAVAEEIKKKGRAILIPPFA